MKSGHLVWAKKEQTSKAIGLQKLSINNRTSTEQEVIVSGQS